MSGGRGNGEIGEAIHVVMFPWLAFGHISPFVQLARKLVSAGDGSSFRVTFLTAAGNVTRVEEMLASAASAVPVRALHLPSVPGPPAGAASTAEVSADGAELLKLSLDGARPQVAALLAELRPAVDAVLFDFATPWVCDVAAPLGATPLYFNVFSAAATAAYLGIAARRRIDGTSTLPPADQTYTNAGSPSAYERFAASLERSAGCVMKTCAEMEGPYISYVSAQFGAGKPVLLAGPVVPEPPRGELDDEPLASWLASFPDNAVVFAWFGSETFLPVPAATELPLGLEATNRPFLAVLNFPKGVDDADEAELDARIPPGFRERVKGRGVVRTGWVQQQHILRHRSVGCFVNHVGFSSVVEGLVAGCHLVLLPLKNDQYFNAALFGNRELRVGVEVARREEDGWFGRGDVAEAVDAAMAPDGEGDARKWRDFFMDDAVQARFADKFIGELKEIVRAA